VSDEGIRLAKRVAETAACSRADAERYIAGGWVSVDGEVVDEPATRVLPAQRVELLPGATAEEPQPVTILLHKPAGLHGKAALDSLQLDALYPAYEGERALKRHLTRLTPAMPLEAMASGLVVFSQDWRIVRKLGQDSDRIEQEYVAEVTGAIAEDGLKRLNAGGKPNAPIKASWQSEARLRFAGKGIVPGQIEALCAQVGLQVTGLRRLRIGRLALSSLPVGQWRYLRDIEKF
jgi:23S rRNA pseudouridine2604 synthase